MVPPKGKTAARFSQVIVPEGSHSEPRGKTACEQAQCPSGPAEEVKETGPRGGSEDSIAESECS